MENHNNAAAATVVVVIIVNDDGDDVHDVACVQRRRLCWGCYCGGSFGDGGGFGGDVEEENKISFFVSWSEYTHSMFGFSSPDHLSDILSI